MITRRIFSGMLGLCMMLLIGCGEAPGLVAPEADEPSALSKQNDAGEFEIEGEGVYLLAETFEVTFALDAEQDGDDGAEGTFRQALVFEGLSIDFSGRVTCLSADPAEGRVWVGGVITRNDSEHPDFLIDITEPGKDIWFRVLDTDDDGTPDRSTFTGFEGSGGLITSEEYCDAQIWPDDNARTHPFIEGGLELEFDDEDDDDD